MAMPRVLKNFNVFNDGQTYIGVVEKVKLPELKRKMEDLRAGGMNGPVKIDMGQDGLTVEHEYAGIASQVLRQWGITKIDGVLLRFAGALQQDNDGGVTAIEVVMRGRHEEISTPEAGGGQKRNFHGKRALTYLIEIIDGVDRLAEQRRAIGMA